MDYILKMLKQYKIKVDFVIENSLRVYGNFKGFSTLRYSENQIIVDGRCTDKEEFENWLYLISL